MEHAVVALRARERAALLAELEARVAQHLAQAATWPIDAHTASTPICCYCRNHDTRRTNLNAMSDADLAMLYAATRSR